MNRKELKKKLVDLCTQMHQQTVERLTEEMNEAYQNAAEYGNPEDWLDTYKMDMLRKRDACSLKLQKVGEEMKMLELINPEKILDKAAFGSVIITETQKLFIAVGLGKVVVDDETYFVISQSVPLFHAMKDHKAGDIFRFRDTEDKILEVF